ncbi:MAG TPA: hypothetical protein VIA98_12535 [Allosphingosinicella sp.]|jgi:hypothetical protein
MAGADLNVSRRALLGAACLAPVLSAAAPFGHDGLAPASTRSWEIGSAPADQKNARRAERWAAALAAFRAAEGAMRAGRSASDARFDRLSDRYYAATRRLLRAPAPDIAALARKLELAIDEEVFTLSGGEACLAAMRRDARRLARRQG